MTTRGIHVRVDDAQGDPCALMVLHVDTSCMCVDRVHRSGLTRPV
jgi:hypothetical protein